MGRTSGVLPENELNEIVTAGPQFRASTSVQPPLTVRLGFRVVF